MDGNHGRHFGRRLSPRQLKCVPVVSRTSLLRIGTLALEDAACKHREVFTLCKACPCLIDWLQLRP